MNAYVITSGAVFALIFVAHIWRAMAEGVSLAENPVFILTSLAALALVLWAWRAVKATPKRTVAAFVNAINSQDWASLDALVAVDFVRHSVAAGQPGVRSRADLVKFLREEYATFPDAHEEIVDAFAAGNKVAVRHHFRGTQRGPLGSFVATAKVMDSDYIAIYLVRGRQIVEAWVEWDNLAGLKQLGHI